MIPSLSTPGSTFITTFTTFSTKGAESCPPQPIWFNNLYCAWHVGGIQYFLTMKILTTVQIYLTSLKGPYVRMDLDLHACVSVRVLFHTSNRKPN